MGIFSLISVIIINLEPLGSAKKKKKIVHNEGEINFFMEKKNND